MLICKEEKWSQLLLFLSFFCQWDCVVPESSVKLGLSCAFLDFSMSKGCTPRFPYFEQVWHWGYTVWQTVHRSVGPCSKSAIPMILTYHLWTTASMPLADGGVSNSSTAKTTTGPRPLGPKHAHPVGGDNPSHYVLLEWCAGVGEGGGYWCIATAAHCRC